MYVMYRVAYAPGPEDPPERDRTLRDFTAVTGREAEKAAREWAASRNQLRPRSYASSGRGCWSGGTGGSGTGNRSTPFPDARGGPALLALRAAQGATPASAWPPALRPGER